MILFQIHEEENLMKTNLSGIALFVCLALSIVLSACGAGEPAATATSAETGTPLPTNTPTLVPTATSTPTRTPHPTSTPNLAATQQYEEILSAAEKFAEEGLIPSTYGRYHPMKDYSISLAKTAYFTWMTYDQFETSNFIIQATATIANETVENAFKSGCGFVFKDAFSNHAVFFSLDGNANYRTDGYDRGSNYLDSTLFENPDGVLLTLLLSEKSMRFYVNDRLAISGITVYGGPFDMGPAVLSSTSEGFGTRCDFTQIAIWDMK
jgi:hypothetical protein